MKFLLPNIAEYFNRLAARVVLFAAVIACTGDPPTSLRSPNSMAGTIAGGSQSQGRTTDEEYERIAREEIAGFAGFYLDERDNVVVLLTDLGKRATAERYAATFRSQFFPSSAGTTPIVRQVMFNYPQLREWHANLAEKIADRFRAALDIDEVENQLWVAVEDAKHAPLVLSAATQLGIPPNAIKVETRQLPRPRMTLRDQFPTMQAGMQIQATNQGLCSHGFSAIYQGRSVFVSASHCTSVGFAPDWQWVYQPTTSGNNIGWETWDIGYYNCYSVLTCRWSDAAIMDYAAHVQPELGIIAWPSGQATYGRPGPIELGDPPGSYYISTKWTAALPVGAGVGKVGRTSGNTLGNVTRACVFINKIMCTYVTDVWSEPGDSGSAFLLFSHPNPGAALAGVLWGGPVGVWTETWFSTLQGLERDLGGTLTVCYPGWGC